ncbi:hypothetical protein Hanom_Chr08g00742891 [Helianthus anomalus]
MYLRYGANKPIPSSAQFKPMFLGSNSAHIQKIKFEIGSARANLRKKFTNEPMLRLELVYSTLNEPKLGSSST